MASTSLSTPLPLPPPHPPTSSALALAHLTQEEHDALQAAVFQRLHPRLYLERYVSERVRPDARLFGEGRGVSVDVGSISTADGSALVRMGETTVVCGVKAEIAEPELDRESLGFLVPNLDLTAMCSPKFKPGPPTEEAQVLSDRLNHALITSNFVSLESLCIHPGKAVWVLYVDATCVNYDGNAFDATLLAMVAALRNTTLPQATYDPETNRTVCSRRLPRVPLQLAKSTPISTSFGIFDSKYVLLDPTAFEEPLLDTSLSIVLGDEGDIVSVAQVGSLVVSVSEGEGEGGEEVRKDVLAECIASAKLRRAEVVDALNVT
ncbi:Exosome complex component RRP43 [Psilocybe cubensis]|uniref:Exosome complex component RRP43 n=2 Tax=Psilocybe cubensis TaxID=181762 RepID=A0ACB8H4S1_PSICU|nr:Exosome complex component RRP43 [Psilocybe cubensis]KAH9482180.1 Exosome complex component RRP43 [Psilocybe cubensis]